MSSLMLQECLQAPRVVAEQLHANEAAIAELCERLAKQTPPFAVTIARGSSDHAATFAKYLLEVQAQCATVSAAPSVTTCYHSPVTVSKALVLGLSQSGKSPDICSVMQSAHDNGGLTVAMVNVEDSPLAEAAEFVVPLHAGPEKAVAATKSYIATLTALTHLVAAYTQNAELLAALKHLPEQLSLSLEQDWSAAVEVLLKADDALVVGRGFGYPVAQEAALKLKETSCLHAEPFSSAEVLHGPFALMKHGFPILQFVQPDATMAGSLELAKKMTGLGAKVCLAVPEGAAVVSAEHAAVQLPLPKSLHPILDPIVTILAFYQMAEALAQARGFDPDQPDNLNKVTETR